ncbi:MAG TPA: diphthine synthase [Patescibacteria group bacterium]|nr:diphthine synthase [Patescibacteria group bacterium]
MLYLIGLGLNEKGISKQGLGAIKKCKKVYLENYTVEFPYSLKELEKAIGKKIESADRNFVESMNELLEEAKKHDIALLVYGSPLTATTHISLIEEAKKKKIKYEIIYNASVLDAVAETGLQLYKFGKIASIPNFQADSFIEIIKQNLSIGAHSLILADIGLEFKDALDRLERAAKKERINAKKLIVCSMLGTDNSKIYYKEFSELKKIKIKAPYCIIIPGKLHFMEEEFLKLIWS